jgi:hypothetical protein
MLGEVMQVQSVDIQPTLRRNISLACHLLLRWFFLGSFFNPEDED